MPGSPFQGPTPNQVQQHKLQSTSLQDFISATPLPGYNWDPSLALYVDQNIPAGLYPRFVHVAHPTINGMQNVSIPVGPGSKPGNTAKFIDMVASGTPGVATPGQAAPAQDPFGGWGEAIMSPTQRPNEPITTGLPFGDGSMFIKMPGEDDQRFQSRVVQALMSSPSTSPDVKAFAARMQRGE